MRQSARADVIATYKADPKWGSAVDPKKLLDDAATKSNAILKENAPKA